MAFDFKKEYREFYLKNQPEIVTVLKANNACYAEYCENGKASKVKNTYEGEGFTLEGRGGILFSFTFHISPAS